MTVFQDGSPPEFASDLHQQNALLLGVAEATRRLLTVSDFDRAVYGALEAIGTAASIDRIYILENYIDPKTGEELGLLPYEWTVPHVVKAQDIPGRFPMSYADFGDWLQRWKQGQPVQVLARDLSAPAWELQKTDEALSLLTVPIRINDCLWGVIGFDDCTTERVWDEADIAVLQTAAASIAGALQRRVDVAELQRRDALLNCVNAASQCLVATEDLEIALPKTLEILGQGTQQCRAYILSVFRDNPTQELMFDLALEWDAPNIPTKRLMGAKFPVPVARFPERFTGPLKAGQPIWFLARELDGIAASEREPGQALSLIGVPIGVEGMWWGLLGLDDCLKERNWSKAEISVLETAAVAIGNAVARDRNQKAREAAERTALLERERAVRADDLEAANLILQTRDRWLETTAAATNLLLSSTNVPESVNAALRIIGENLECDRVFVLQAMERSNAPAGDPGYAKLTYEWHAEGLIPHIDIPEIAEIPGDRFKASVQKFRAGEWVGGVVAELPEPLRSHQESLGVKSLYTVPVFFNDEMWGVVGINHCYQAKRLSVEEIAVFKTAATCIGSAIYQESARRDQAAQERARLLGAVAEVSNLLLRAVNFEDVLPEAARLLGEAVDCDRCGIGRDVFHPATGHSSVEVRPDWEWRSPSTLPAASFSPDPTGLYSWEDGPFLTEQMRQGRAASYLVTDLPEKDRQLMAVQGTTATLFFPITVHRMLWGFIHFDSNRSDPRMYDDAEISILQVAAESIAAAIARRAQDEALRQSEQAILAERERAARERALELAKTNEAIAQTLNVLTTTPDLTDFLLQILTKINEQIEADCTHLFLYNSETSTLSSHLVLRDGVVYSGNAPDDPPIFFQDIPTDINPTWQELIESPKPISRYIDRPGERDRHWPTVREWHHFRQHQSTTMACMKVGEQPIGLIGFAFRQRMILTDEQLEFVQALTNQATLAIHFTRLAEQAKVNALNEERTRLAREIHDTLAQAFTGVSIQLEAVRGIITSSPSTTDITEAQTYIRRARDLARAGLSEARRSVRALRAEALETDNLPKALQKGLAQAERDAGLKANFYLEGAVVALPDDLELDLLRISQEAITNVLRHARATQLDLTLSFGGDRIQLRIVDNGIGFDTAELWATSGFGLIGIRERVARLSGTFELLSTPDIGTTLDVTIPLRTS